MWSSSSSPASRRETSSVHGGIRSLGLAASTTSSGNSAKSLYEYWLENVNSPRVRFDQLTNEHVVEDNLIRLLLDYATWLAETKIPRNRKKGTLEPSQPPTEDNPTSYLVPKTLEKYLGQFKEDLKWRFDYHAAWNDHTGEGRWYTKLLANMSSKAESNQGRSAESFGNRSVRQIYKNNSRTCMVEHGRDLELSSLLDSVDLSWIGNNLMKEATEANENMQKRAQLAITFNAVGRGGEVKFVQYGDWIWDPRFSATDINWYEMKTLETYTMPMVSDNDGYEMDFYHSIGSYWVCEQGLYRDKATVSASDDFVFPSLHSSKDANVAKKLTEIIRTNIPAEISSDVRASFSSKSLRKGGITEMQAHPGIGIFEACARSGHSTGTTLDWYSSKHALANSLPGARAIAGWDDVREGGRPPSLAVLEASQSYVKVFIEKLLIVEVSDFKEDGGKLHPVLLAVVATLIMYHPKVLQRFGSQNLLVSKMINAAEAANIKDPTLPAGVPQTSHQVLCHWSAKLVEDFRMKNNATSGRVSTPREMFSLAERQASDIRELKSAVNSMRSLLETMISQNYRLADQQSKIESCLLEENNVVNKELKSLKRKVACLKSPPASPAKKRQNQEEAVAVPFASIVHSVDSDDDSSDRSKEDDQKKTAATKPAEALKLGYQAKLASTISASNKKQQNKGKKGTGTKNSKSMHLRTIISTMYPQKIFKKLRSFGKPLSEMDNPPAWIPDERKKFYSTMDLLDFVMTHSDWKDLSEDDLGERRLREISSRLEKAAMDQLLKMEGKSEANSRMKASYVAIGKRVAEILKKKGNKSVAEMFHPDEGTPPWAKSMRVHFRSTNLVVADTMSESAQGVAAAIAQEGDSVGDDDDDDDEKKDGGDNN